MTNELLRHTVVPVANETDASTTCNELESVIEEHADIVTVVHVIEKTAGYMDKAPLEARQEQAEQIFSIVEDRFADGPRIRRELRYGTDVVDAILAAAADVDATAIGFVTRPRSRLRRLLFKSDAYRLITESERPLVVFSRHESDDDPKHT